MPVTSEHDKIMERAKLDVFLADQNNAFLTSLLCTMTIEWSEKIPTACTDGLQMLFNPDWFMSLPMDTRPTIILHELWHVGYLHIIRGQGLEKRRFNHAADYVINAQLKLEGYSFDGASPLLDMQYHGMTAEQVYDLLPPDPPADKQKGCWSDDPEDCDMEPSEGSSSAEEIVAAVHVATIAQQRTGHTSAEVDAIAELIKKRNQPKVNWKAELKDFSQEKAKVGLDYKKRNRRYNHVVLPARGKRGRLIELAYFFDVSGSVTQNMAAQMLSEVAFIWEVLKPKKLHIIQFDTSIRKVDTWTAGQGTESIEIVGRGGTSLEPVAKWLEKNKPHGAVIMTDLCCPVMREVKNVPILWLCINNPGATVQQGKLIHIQVGY
jgi:predicted metal-dependent peptidase